MAGTLETRLRTALQEQEATARGSSLRPFSDEEWAAWYAAQESFWEFLTRVYPLSFLDERYLMADRKWRPFSLSDLHRKWAMMAQAASRVCILAPRSHLKSTVLGRGFLFWQGFKSKMDFDAVYFSYKDTLAREHTMELKKYILRNAYCRFWIDNKPTSDSIVDFTVRWSEDDPGHRFEVMPMGILGAARGLHPKAVVADDILSDFSKPMESTELNQINRIFRQVVMSMPQLHEPLILVGTPQSEKDILHQLRGDRRWFWRRYPAIRDEKKRTTQWPEKFDYARLMEVLDEIKPTAFQVEYLLQPAVETKQYFPRHVVNGIVDEELRRWTTEEPWPGRGKYPVYGGMDVGKEVHPSHVTLFAQMPDGTLMQIWEEWLDHMDYRAQALRVNQLIEHFDVARFFYDSTRSELDDRALNRRAQGKKFKKPLKAQMAVMFEKRVYSQPGEPGIILLGKEDSRQVRQICAVKKDLSAYESEDGHGDSFWSISLAIYAADAGPSFVDMGDAGQIFGGWF